MSDSVVIAVITAIEHVLNTALTPTVAIVVTYYLNRRSRRRSHRAISEKLDAIALAHDRKLTACNDVVVALTTQVTRLQTTRRTRDPAHDDVSL